MARAAYLHFEHCPMPGPRGQDCFADPHPASRFGLCVEHWREVVQDWVADTPETSRLCLRCGIRNRYDTADWASARCGGCGIAVDAPWLLDHDFREQQRQTLQPTDAAVSGVVYYLRFGDLIKIGFSTSLATRILVIPHDEVIAAEPGSLQLERSRHRQFASDLRDGQREWFNPGAALLDHVAAVVAEHGDPMLVGEAEPLTVDEAAVGMGYPTWSHLVEEEQRGR